MFREKVRFIGAGTIGVAAIWTLLKIIGPIIKGITARDRRQPRAPARGRATALPLTERDLPITIVGGTILASMIPIALLLSAFADSGPIAADAGADASAVACSTSSSPASSSPRSPATWPA